MTINIIQLEDEGKTCVKLLLIGSVVIASLGLLQQIIAPAAGGLTTTAGYARANTLGSFLLIMIGISMGMYLYDTSKLSLIYFGIFVLLLGTLVFTKSRGAYVSVVPLVGIIAYITRSGKLITIMILGLLFVVSLMFMDVIFTGKVKLLADLHSDDFTQQFQSISDMATKGLQADSSMAARVAFWKASFPKMLKYPFLGRGVGSIALGTADNQYVREILETGLVGFLCLIYMNIVILAASHRVFVMSKDPLIKGFSAGFLGGHVGMLVHAMTISNFYTILTMEVFWFVTALIMLFEYAQRHPEVSAILVSKEKKNATIEP